jgi:hypothetical protein
MVNISGGVAAAAGVDAHVLIQFANAYPTAFGYAAGGFAIGNLFAQQFSHFPASAKRDCREATHSIDSRFSHDQRRCGLSTRTSHPDIFE